jgi:transcriptional regulator with XRE-family HTH domain
MPNMFLQAAKERRIAETQRLFTEAFSTRGLSQAEVASAMGVSRQMISLWCCGKRLPSNKALTALHYLLYPKPPRTGNEPAPVSQTPVSF